MSHIIRHNSSKTWYKQKHNDVLLPKKLFVQEKETQLRKKEKPPTERESVKLVKNLEEKQKEDLRDDNSPLFLIYILMPTVSYN